jgi:uncharacterized protein (DUF2141 family)
MKVSAAIALLALLAPVAALAQSATLTVRVENVSLKGGNLRLALYDRAHYDADGDAVADRVVSAKTGPNLVTFDGIEPGEYAIKMFQDANRNEKFDQSWLGLPQERYGFSNNAGPDWLHLGPPRFDAAKIKLKAGANFTAIRLR